MNKKIYELSLELNDNTSGQIEVIEDVCLNLGFALSEIFQIEKNRKHLISLFFCDHSKLLQAKKTFGQLKLRGVKLLSKSLAQSEWLTKWQDDFKPFKLTDTFWVIPAWEKRPQGVSQERSIIIGEGVAFGTGLHPTTRYMSRFIERIKPPIEKFLDIGTGTGILSILAHKCGAKKIAAIDINEEAVKTAEDNFGLNGVLSYHGKCMDFKNWRSRAKFDYIAANLITEDLLIFKQKLYDLIQESGYLAISGISVDNFNRVKKAFREFPLRCVKIEKAEGWCGILYQRKARAS